MSTALRVPPSPPPASAVSPSLRALADPMRWRVVELLAREELCVCHLVEELHAPQSLVSHHLKVLRDAGLVVGERWRYWTYYRLVPGALRAVADHLLLVDERGASGAARTRRPCC